MIRDLKEKGGTPLQKPTASHRFRSEGPQDQIKRLRARSRGSRNTPVAERSSTGCKELIRGGGFVFVFLLALLRKSDAVLFGYKVTASAHLFGPIYH